MRHAEITCFLNQSRQRKVDIGSHYILIRESWKCEGKGFLARENACLYLCLTWNRKLIKIRKGRSTWHQGQFGNRTGWGSETWVLLFRLY